MNHNWRFIPYSVHSAVENMAIDEAIFRCFPNHKINTIRLYGWFPSAVSIGRNQSIEQEVDIAALKDLEFDVVRRISGGGAVFHDSEGELTYSIVVANDYLKDKEIEDSYYYLVNLIVKYLAKWGINFDTKAIHCPSLFIDNKKVSGNAQARSNDCVLQHGTVLVQYRPEIMYRVLKAKKGTSREKMIRSVYHQITTLSLEKRELIPVKKVVKFLQKEIITNFQYNISTGTLFKDEVELVEKLIVEKYSSDEWTYSK